MPTPVGVMSFTRAQIGTISAFYVISVIKNQTGGPGWPPYCARRRGFDKSV